MDVFKGKTALLKRFIVTLNILLAKKFVQNVLRQNLSEVFDQPNA